MNRVALALRLQGCYGSINAVAKQILFELIF